MTGRALVVDDSRVNRMLPRRALTELGIESVEAGNGINALELLRRGPFDVILLDLVMPEVDGYTTLERIKAQPALAHLPVSVITDVLRSRAGELRRMVDGGQP